MTERCQNGKPVRSWHGMVYAELWPGLDRNYWHPCTKIWRQPSCRGLMGYRMPIVTGAKMTWVGPGFPHYSMPPGDSWLLSMHQYRDRRMAEHPHLCG